MRSRVLIATAVLAALVAASVPAAAGARTYYPNCQGKLRYKPRALTVFCADAGVQIKRIHWYEWRAREARGRSRYAYANDCTPDCADGTFRRYRARLVLRRVRTCDDGRRGFTRMAVIFLGARKPAGLGKFTQPLVC